MGKKVNLRHHSSPSFTSYFQHLLRLALGAGLWGAAQQLAPPPSSWVLSAAAWTESGDRRTVLTAFS